MRINNVSEQRSFRNFSILLVVFIILTTGLIWLLMNSVITDTAYLFTNLLMFFDLFGNPLLNCIFPILILGFYIWFFKLAFLKIKRWLEFYNSLNVKYINLLPGRVDFVYTDSKYNFSCAYSDIQNLNIDFFLDLKSTKTGIFVFTKEMDLRFTISDDKVVTLSNTTYFTFGVVRKIIDYTRGIKSFTFNLLRKSGTFAEEFEKDEYKFFPELRDFKSRIENYYKYGKRTILSKEFENSLTMLTIFMSVCPVIIFGLLLLEFPDKGFLTMGMPIFLLVIGFIVILDIILLKNEERKPKTQETLKSKDEALFDPAEVSIYGIIKLQVVALTLFICESIYSYWQDILGFLF